jgi:hypothetical protein
VSTNSANDRTEQPGPLKKQYTMEGRNAAPVCSSNLFAANRDLFS